MTRLLLVASLALTACAGDTGTLRFDLSGLARQDAQFALPIDRLRVAISGPQNGEVGVEVDLDNPVFDLSTASGPLYIEGFAERADGSPTYYGDQRVVLPPNGVVEVVVPMFPAGLIDVTVLIDPEDAPRTAVVTFLPLAPRSEQSTAFDATFDVSKILRVLPSGEYTFRAQASFDGGETYEAVGPTSEVITIPAGGRLAETFDLTDL